MLHDPRGLWEQPAYSIWSEDETSIHGTAIRTEQWRYDEYGIDAANGALLLDVHVDPWNVTTSPTIPGTKALDPNNPNSSRPTASQNPRQPRSGLNYFGILAATHPSNIATCAAGQAPSQGSSLPAIVAE